jgi:S1-C subfamily serine protease
MKKLLIVLVVLVAIPTIVFSDEPDKKLHQDCLYPSVQIRNAFVSGSGTIVRSDKIGNDYHNVVLSCAHIFTKENVFFMDTNVRVPKYKEWSVFEKYENYEAFLYKIDREFDLSIILFASKEKMPIANLDFSTKLYIGSDVFHIGSGLGEQQRLEYGKITSVNSYTSKPEVYRTLRTSIYTVPGDSGTGVFHNYKVIGVMRSIRKTRNTPLWGISYCIPLVMLKKWDEELNNIIAFVYEAKKPLPVIPFVDIKLKLLMPELSWENL